MKSSTRQFLQRHGLAVLIGALVVGLLGVIAFEAQWGGNLRQATVVAPGQRARASDTSLLPAFVLPTIDTAFKETVDRPLFLPSRRPVPVASGAGQSAMKKGQFKLAGTVINHDIPYAFLVEIATGKGVRVAKGADILSTGISVSMVDTVRVVLKQGEETEELSLRTAASPPPAAQAMPLPGAQGTAPVTAMPRPPPSSAGIPGMPMPIPGAGGPLPQGGLPGGPVPGGVGAPMPLPVPLPTSSAMPGFVPAPEATAQNPPQSNPVEATAGSQRRRRSPNVPQQ